MVMVIGSEKKRMVGYGCTTILTIIAIITIFGYNSYKMLIMVMEWFLWS